MIGIIGRWDAAVRAARPDGAGDTVLRRGAAVGDVEALEARLGTRLPPSYRAFLLHSDGAAAQPGIGLATSGVGLLDCAQVGWFRDRERSYVDIWSTIEPDRSDAAAALATLDDVLALRALARRRDPRALAPLLDLLNSSDDTDRLQAADGLRDLRDHAAAAPLHAALRRGGTQDFIATAAHALVSMAASETDDALALIARSDDPALRRLAESWSDGH